MARRTRTAPETIEEAPTTVPTPAAPVRRTRRRRVVDHASQAQLIIASLLGSRGSAGASQAEVQQVVLWARGVHAEAAELATLAKRPRLRKAELLPERLASSDLNKVLLDGVISGKLAIDVTEGGEILFRGGAGVGNG